jgi:hypothetical protein
MWNARFRLGEDLAKAIIQENLQRYVFLTNESALRQLVRRE